MGVPINREIKSPTGNTVASNWAALLDDLSDTLSHLGAATTFWWSGSAADGSYDSANSCVGWTSGDNCDSGYDGAHNNASFPTWIRRSTRNCNNSLELLCLCW